MNERVSAAPPCALEDVPEIDAIVISHNHYDQCVCLFPFSSLLHWFSPSRGQSVLWSDRASLTHFELFHARDSAWGLDLPFRAQSDFVVALALPLP